MKRTTLKFDDAILRKLKKQAAEEGRSFQEVANRLLRQALATSGPTNYKLSIKGWKATLQPGVDLLDRDKLLDIMDGR